MLLFHHDFTSVDRTRGARELTRNDSFYFSFSLIMLMDPKRSKMA